MLVVIVEAVEVDGIAGAFANFAIGLLAAASDFAQNIRNFARRGQHHIKAIARDEHPALPQALYFPR